MNPYKRADAHTIDVLVRIALGTALTASLLCVCLPIWAKTAPQTEIRVTLLGQPCLLQGPFDEATLVMIHRIGPAQLYPVLESSDPKGSKELAKKALEKIRSGSSLPSLLDRYRDKLGKRLTAQIELLDNLETYKKTHEPSLLVKTAKRFLRDPDAQQFETIVKKLKVPSKTPAQAGEAIDQLFDCYNDGIEPDPEEEFHRAIKKLNVQYTCSFEETDDQAGE